MQKHYKSNRAHQPTSFLSAEQVRQDKVDARGIDELGHFCSRNSFNHTHQRPEKKTVCSEIRS